MTTNSTKDPRWRHRIIAGVIVASVPFSLAASCGNDDGVPEQQEEQQGEDSGDEDEGEDEGGVEVESEEG